MESYYIIHSYIDGKYLSSTDIINLKDDVLYLKEKFDNNNSNITNTIFYSSPLNESTKSTDMSLYKYLNGYLLIPTKNHTYYGMERLNNGIWMDDVEGWFYDKQNSIRVSEYKLNKEKLKINYKKYNLHQLESYFYKDGFILLPNNLYKYYGQFNLMGGKWIPSEKGWYFKNMKKYNKFLKYGVNDTMLDNFME